MVKTCSDCIHTTVCGKKTSMKITFKAGTDLKTKVKAKHVMRNGLANICDDYKEKEVEWSKNCGNCSQSNGANKYCRNGFYVGTPEHNQCGAWDFDVDKWLEKHKDPRVTGDSNGHSRRAKNETKRRKTKEKAFKAGEAIRGITLEEAKAQTGISFLHEMRDINTGSYTGKEGVCEVRRIIDGNLVTDHFRRSPKAQTKAKISYW